MDAFGSLVWFDLVFCTKKSLHQSFNGQWPCVLLCWIQGEEGGTVSTVAQAASLDTSCKRFQGVWGPLGQQLAGFVAAAWVLLGLNTFAAGPL